MDPQMNKKFTKPRSPFSERNLPSAEKRKQQTRDLKPNKQFHDFHTIKWLRRRYDERVIQKSIFSLLPDNGNPVIDFESETPVQKHHRLLMTWLSTHCQPYDRFRNVCINPKYFFNQKTFEKILKLKEIFLEFDGDNSRKMEINEMEEMFNSNNIEATINELVSLFFKGKKILPEDLPKLYLDFYQFMQFALSKDQDFRMFMRNIKEKVKRRKEEEKANMNIQDSETEREKGKQEENGYLPMNFNLVLDYFIIKGKERGSKDIIEKAIEEMKNIIDDENDNRGTLSQYDYNDKKAKEEDIYDSQQKNINFVQLIQEFSKLFHIKDEKDVSPTDTKKRGTVNRSKTHTVSKDRTRRNSNPNNNAEPNLKNINENEQERDLQDSTQSFYYYSELLNHQLCKDDISKMNMDNYNKYHSLKIALDETKKAIESASNPKKRHKNEASNANTTMSRTGFLPKINPANHYNRNRQVLHEYPSARFTRKKPDHVPIILLKELSLV